MGQNVGNWKHHQCYPLINFPWELGLKEKEKLFKFCFWVSTRMQPVNKLESFEISVKHAVSGKDQEENSS